MTRDHGEIAESYRQAFEVNAEGRRVFEHLSKLFAKPPDLSGGADALLVTYGRACQREVLDHILRMVARANGEQATDPPLAETD